MFLLQHHVKPRRKKNLKRKQSLVKRTTMILSAADSWPDLSLEVVQAHLLAATGEAVPRDLIGVEAEEISAAAVRRILGK
jgi:hypothetical protein